MDVEIVEFKEQPSKTKLAVVIVSYGCLLLRCELVYNTKDNKAWIRMPERWINRTHKIRDCYWPNQIISNEFQKVVLNKIFDKYDLNIEKVAQMHKDSMKKCKKRLDLI